MSNKWFIINAENLDFQVRSERLSIVPLMGVSNISIEGCVFWFSSFERVAEGSRCLYKTKLVMGPTGKASAIPVE